MQKDHWWFGSSFVVGADVCKEGRMEIRSEVPVVSGWTQLKGVGRDREPLSLVKGGRKRNGQQTPSAQGGWTSFPLKLC